MKKKEKKVQFEIHTIVQVYQSGERREVNSERKQVKATHQRATHSRLVMSFLRTRRLFRGHECVNVKRHSP